MSTNITVDNNYKYELEVSSEDVDNLRLIADYQISEIISQDNSNLLIFPYDLNISTDRIGNGCVCGIVNGNKVRTNNIMGFIGVNNTQLTIRSRFCNPDKEDYFMHYMLQKVFSINLFDLKHSSSNESVFDFLLYLFPYYLKKALKQGLFKQYQKRQFNDANIRGSIDVNRHIKQNILFAGKVAYNTREHSCNNYVTQLIRHTIEYIKTHRFGVNILHGDSYTEECVQIIYDATGSYDRNNRISVLNNNRKPICHPYYSEYTLLQKLCKQILTYKGLKYGQKNDKIYGLLFDGAWLWEEYLYTILKKCGFKHPQNKVGKDYIYLFDRKNNNEDNLFETHSRCRRYPDFYKEGIILDAKYKKMQNHCIDRDDIHQIISYMYVEKAIIGGFVHPTRRNENKINEIGKLRGYGGQIQIYDVAIPQDSSTFVEFCKRMKEVEDSIERHYCHVAITM